MLQVRQLVREEKTSTIVLFFSLTAALLSAVTWFFGWADLSWWSLGLLALAGFFGGLGQIFLTESYRYADVSTIAPFEYTSILLGSGIAYVLFGDIPTLNTLVGTAIVARALRWAGIAPGCFLFCTRAAFEAADLLMDYLKSRALFWKSETGAQGRVWIEPRDEDYADAARWDKG